MLWLLLACKGPADTADSDTAPPPDCLEPVSVQAEPPEALSLSGTAVGYGCLGDWYDACPDPAAVSALSPVVTFVDPTTGATLDATLTVDGASVESLPSCTELTLEGRAEGYWPTRLENQMLDAGSAPALEMWTEDAVLSLAAASGQVLSGSKGAVVGAALDCTYGRVSAVQAFLIQGDTVQSAVYFKQGAPSSQATATDATGRFAFVNAPTGASQVQLWGLIDGSPTLLARAPIFVEAETLTQVRMLPGRADGVDVPDACAL